MKQLLLTLISIFAFTCNIVANSSFWHEGKRWVLDKTYPAVSQELLTIYVCGDTTVNDIKCKKVYQQDNISGNKRLAAFGFQTGTKVYCYYPDSTTPELLYDFGLGKGDKFLFSNEIACIVENTDYVSFYEKNLKRWHIMDNSTKDDMGYWIENIGSIKGPLSPLALPGNYYQLNYCMVDETIIFKSSLAKDVVQEISMLSNNTSWIYSYDFDYDENRNNGHSNSTYGISFSVIGEKNIKGKTYKKLYVVALRYASHSTRSTDNGDANYALALREESGKVLVDYDEYINYLRKEFANNNIIPKGDSLFIPYHKTQEGELVLYDFNMQIGDKYSHIEGYQDISVVDIKQIVFDDGKNRKLFTLSNGAKIIEGIGCINSCGLLFDYLNPRKPSYNNDKQHFAYLAHFYKDDFYIEQEDIITNIHTIKFTCEKSSSYYYDLQGRKVKNPKKGLYIKDGKRYYVR